MTAPITRNGKQLMLNGCHAADCASEEVAEMLAMLANGQATVEPTRSIEGGVMMLVALAGAFFVGGIVL